MGFFKGMLDQWNYQDKMDIAEEEQAFGREKFDYRKSKDKKDRQDALMASLGTASARRVGAGGSSSTSLPSMQHSMALLAAEGVSKENIASILPSGQAGLAETVTRILKERDDRNDTPAEGSYNANTLFEGMVLTPAGEIDYSAATSYLGISEADLDEEYVPGTGITYRQAIDKAIAPSPDLSFTQTPGYKPADVQDLKLATEMVDSSLVSHLEGLISTTQRQLAALGEGSDEAIALAKVNMDRTTALNDLQHADQPSRTRAIALVGGQAVFNALQNQPNLFDMTFPDPTLEALKNQYVFETREDAAEAAGRLGLRNGDWIKIGGEIQLIRRSN